MRKLKGEFILNEKETEMMKRSKPDVLGIYNYKDYFIIDDIVSETGLKHVSVSRTSGKKVKTEELKIIADHFINGPYEFVQFILGSPVVHILEKKED